MRGFVGRVVHHDFGHGHHNFGHGVNCGMSCGGQQCGGPVGNVVHGVGHVVHGVGGAVHGAVGGFGGGVAQSKAQLAASRGLKGGHVGGGFGGGRFEGVGFSSLSGDDAVRRSCYWGQRPVQEVGVARGFDGWYACVIYR